MTAVVVHADIDDAVEKAASAVLTAEGLTPSSVFRQLIHWIARNKAVPYEALEPGEVTRRAIEEARAGKGKSFATVEDLMADLNADD